MSLMMNNFITKIKDVLWDYFWSDGILGIISFVLVSLVGLVLLVIIAAMTDQIIGYDQQITVTVMEKVYSPETSGRLVTMGIPDISESYRLLVKDSAGTLFTHRVKPSVYASVNKNQKINITVRMGRFGGRYE